MRKSMLRPCVISSERKRASGHCLLHKCTETAPPPRPPAEIQPHNATSLKNPVLISLMTVVNGDIIAKKAATPASTKMSPLAVPGDTFACIIHIEN